jgi:hypothetical protein
MEAYPKPRHQYIYNPRPGQRGILTYAGQQQNGAYPAGVIPNGGYAGYGGVGMGVGVGVGMGMGVAVAAGGHPGVYAARPYQPYHQSYSSPYSYYGNSYAASSYYPSYSPAYSGYYNYGLYGSMYPLANFYSPYQRTYYNTAPSYGYSAQAYVYPPGPSATTTTTACHVTNSHASTSAYTTPRMSQHGPPPGTHGPTREDLQMENRRIATERGAYSARRIKPADARADDPFWCKERNGEWHLRSFYQIENECHPGRWLMDAEMGFLVYHRD